MNEASVAEVQFGEMQGRPFLAHVIHIIDNIVAAAISLSERYKMTVPRLHNDKSWI